jgi:hypothetical protein
MSNKHIDCGGAVWIGQDAWDYAIPKRILRRCQKCGKFLKENEVEKVK